MSVVQGTGFASRAAASCASAPYGGVTVNVDALRPAPDPDLWERPEARRALATRDLAAVFRLLRRTGVSQRAIAALTGLAPSEVYEIGRGRRVMAYDVLCRIADGLGVPRGYLGLAYDAETAAFVRATDLDADQRDADLDEVGALLAHAAAVAVGMEAGPAGQRWTAPREAGTPLPARVARRDVDRIEAVTGALRGLDYGHGGGACREAVVAQSRWVHELLHADAPDDVRHRLALASADLDNLAGWTSFDVGLFGSARGYFARALTQARRAGDASLVANVLYRAGRLHLHLGLTREALRFFQLGRIAAAEAACPVTLALLAANEAWAHAMLGDAVESTRALDRAHEDFARADGPSAPWMRFFGSTDLQALEGMAHLELARTDREHLAGARRMLEAALESRPADMTRSRTFEVTALAVAVLLDGEVDAGVALGEEAVELAQRVRSVRVLDRLKPLGAAAAATRGTDARALAHRVEQVAAGWPRPADRPVPPARRAHARRHHRRHPRCRPCGPPAGGRGAAAQVHEQRRRAAARGRRGRADRRVGAGAPSRPPPSSRWRAGWSPSTCRPCACTRECPSRCGSPVTSSPCGGPSCRAVPSRPRATWRASSAACTAPPTCPEGRHCRTGTCSASCAGASGRRPGSRRATSPS